MSKVLQIAAVLLGGTLSAAGNAGSVVAATKGLPPVNEAPPPVCAFADLKLPDDFRVFAAGNYSGKELPFQIDQSGHQATQIDIDVNSAGKPVVLVLGAYEPTVWNLRWSPKTQILAVLVSGYHRQAIAGLGKKTAVLNSSLDNHGACPWFYISPTTLEPLNPLSRRLFGRAVDRVYVAPRGWVLVGDPVSGDEQWLNNKAITVDSFRDPNAPMAGPAGLEDAARKGILRRGTDADAMAWEEAVEKSATPKDLPPIDGQVAPRRPYFSEAYVVLKPFVFPAGLYGANSATFIVPSGVPAPTGNPGHSTVYDFNTLQCGGVGCPQPQ